MPYQVIYSSVSSTPLEIDDLEDILESAQIANASEGITGALVYVDGHFLQVLEGEQKSVEDLMRRIVKDLRHEAVDVLHAGEVAEATFRDWQMAYVSATPEQIAVWAGLPAQSPLPQVWHSIRQSPDKAARMRASILSALPPASVQKQSR